MKFPGRKVVLALLVSIVASGCANGRLTLLTTAITEPPVQLPSYLNDVDQDGIVNAADNCIAFSNPQQTDTDTDGTGDLCDPTPAGEAACTPPSACEFGSECCEGQFCTSRNECADETCQITPGTCRDCSSPQSGSRCRPDFPNDCCSAQFCSQTSNSCETCPQGAGESNLGFGVECSDDLTCIELANSGAFDATLLSVGYDPAAIDGPYFCNFSRCAVRVLTPEDLVAACQGGTPPPPVCEFGECADASSCPDESFQCIEGCCLPREIQCGDLPPCFQAQISYDPPIEDPSLACDTLVKDFIDPAGSAACVDECCVFIEVI